MHRLSEITTPFVLAVNTFSSIRLVAASLPASSPRTTGRDKRSIEQNRSQILNLEQRINLRRRTLSGGRSSSDSLSRQHSIPRSLRDSCSRLLTFRLRFLLLLNFRYDDRNLLHCQILPSHQVSRSLRGREQRGNVLELFQNLP